jgi:hypothetical protein
MEARSESRARDHLGKIPNALVWGLASAMTIAVFASAGSYIDDYRQAGSTILPSFENLSGSPKAQAVFDQYNIVGETFGNGGPLVSRTTLNTYALAAEVDLRFIGRFYGMPNTRLGDRIQNPVGMIVFEFDCYDFHCLSNVDKSAIAFKGSGIAVVRLSPSTRALSRIPEANWVDWVATTYMALGGTLNGLTTQGIPA